MKTKRLGFIRGALIAGYPTISLCGHGVPRKEYVHRLVLFTFVGPCPRGMQARHYPDPNRTNVRLDNLSWAPRIENEHDKIEHGTSNHGKRNTTKLDVKADVSLPAFMPSEIIADGKIVQKNLKELDLTEDWLMSGSCIFYPLR